MHEKIWFFIILLNTRCNSHRGAKRENPWTVFWRPQPTYRLSLPAECNKKKKMKRSPGRSVVRKSIPTLNFLWKTDSRDVAHQSHDTKIMCSSGKKKSIASTRSSALAWNMHTCLSAERVKQRERKSGHVVFNSLISVDKTHRSHPEPPADSVP